MSELGQERTQCWKLSAAIKTENGKLPTKTCATVERTKIDPLMAACNDIAQLAASPSNGAAEHILDRMPHALREIQSAVRLIT